MYYWRVSYASTTKTEHFTNNSTYFSEDPLCPYDVLDNYKDLRDKFDIMTQENASLKFKLQGLMNKNLALQKAFTHTGKEAPVVNYVENVNLIFILSIFVRYFHSAFSIIVH